MNDLFKLSYDFDNLKSALGQMLKALNYNTKTCNDMKKTIDNQNKEITRYKNNFMIIKLICAVMYSLVYLNSQLLNV